MCSPGKSFPQGWLGFNTSVHFSLSVISFFSNCCETGKCYLLSPFTWWGVKDASRHCHQNVMGCCSCQGIGLGIFPCKREKQTCLFVCLLVFFQYEALNENYLCLLHQPQTVRAVFFLFLIFFSNIEDLMTIFYPEWGRYLKVLNVLKDGFASSMPLYCPILLFLLNNYFYWKEAGKYFFFNHVEIKNKCFRRKLPVFLLFQSNFRMMDIIARNISPLVSSVWWWPHQLL